MSAENLFKRNLEWVYNIRYDLQRVHSPAIVDMLNSTADHLLLDSQTLSVALRTIAAYHEDCGRIYIANSPQRSRFIIEYNLLVTNVGSGKSTVINSLIDVTRKKRMFDCYSVSQANKSKVQENYRHGTIQEFTGPGIMKALKQTGNLFIVIDEFDGFHHKCAMFPSDQKNTNATTSASAVLKSLHTGLTTYQKFQASGNFFVQDPHVCFLGASNGAPILDILKYKIKNRNIADAMSMRTVFEAIKSPPKFNATYANQMISNRCISWELFLLASSLLTNQTFVFDNVSNSSANTMMLDYMDTIIDAASKWDGIDPWISSRFAKTCELVARVAAQLTHIDLTMEILQQYIIGKNITDCNATVSYERYCDLRDYIRVRYSSAGNIVTIKVHQVEAAIYVTDTILLKYFNLFDTDITRSHPFDRIPLNPLPTLSSPIIASTGSSPQDNKELELKQSILNFNSVAFTRTMLYRISKIRSNNETLDKILHDLITSNLLRKYERGVWSANSRTDLYIKSLPDSLAPDTTNQWTISILNQVKITWTKYIESCSTLLFPTATARFSSEVNELFATDPYMKIIQVKIKPSRSSFKGDVTNRTFDTESTITILPAIESHDAQSPSIDVSSNTRSQPPGTIDLSSRKSPIPDHVLPSVSQLMSTTGDHIIIDSNDHQSSYVDIASPVHLRLQPSKSAIHPVQTTSNSDLFDSDHHHLSSIEMAIPIDLQSASTGPHLGLPSATRSISTTNIDCVIDHHDYRSSSINFSSSIDHQLKQHSNAPSCLPTVDSSIIPNDKIRIISPLSEGTNTDIQENSLHQGLTKRSSERIAMKSRRSYSLENDQSQYSSASSKRKRKKNLE